MIGNMLEIDLGIICACLCTFGVFFKGNNDKRQGFINCSSGTGCRRAGPPAPMTRRNPTTCSLAQASSHSNSPEDAYPGRLDKPITFSTRRRQDSGGFEMPRLQYRSRTEELLATSDTDFSIYDSPDTGSESGQNNHDSSTSTMFDPERMKLPSSKSNSVVSINSVPEKRQQGPSMASPSLDRIERAPYSSHLNHVVESHRPYNSRENHQDHQPFHSIVSGTEEDDLPLAYKYRNSVSSQWTDATVLDMAPHSQSRSQ